MKKHPISSKSSKNCRQGPSTATTTPLPPTQLPSPLGTRPSHFTFSTRNEAHVPPPSFGLAHATSNTISIPSTPKPSSRSSPDSKSIARSCSPSRMGYSSGAENYSQSQLLPPTSNASAQFTDQMLWQMNPKMIRRAPKYKDAQPSKFCHLCSRKRRGIRRLVCTVINDGRCRKTICEKCAVEHSIGDFETLFRQQSIGGDTWNWKCTHCLENCPEKAQCNTYGRVNDKLRLSRLKSDAKAPSARIRKSTVKLVDASSVLDFFEQNMPTAVFVGLLENRLRKSTERMKGNGGQLQAEGDSTSATNGKEDILMKDESDTVTKPNESKKDTNEGNGYKKPSDTATTATTILYSTTNNDIVSFQRHISSPGGSNTEERNCVSQDPPCRILNDSTRAASGSQHLNKNTTAVSSMQIMKPSKTNIVTVSVEARGVSKPNPRCIKKTKFHHQHCAGPRMLPNDVRSRATTSKAPHTTIVEPVQADHCASEACAQARRQMGMVYVNNATPLKLSGGGSEIALAQNHDNLCEALNSETSVAVPSTTVTVQSKLISKGKKITAQGHQNNRDVLAAQSGIGINTCEKILTGNDARSSSGNVTLSKIENVFELQQSEPLECHYGNTQPYEMIKNGQEQGRSNAPILKPNPSSVPVSNQFHGSPDLVLTKHVLHARAQYEDSFMPASSIGSACGGSVVPTTTCHVHHQPSDSPLMYVNSPINDPLENILSTGSENEDIPTTKDGEEHGVHVFDKCLPFGDYEENANSAHNVRVEAEIQNISLGIDKASLIATGEEDRKQGRRLKMTVYQEVQGEAGTKDKVNENCHQQETKGDESLLDLKKDFGI